MTLTATAFTLGLTSSEARRRAGQFGPNTVTEQAPPAWRAYLAKFRGPIPWLLEIAIVLQIGLDHYVEAAVVSGLLLFNATLGFIQEGRANAALTALRKESGDKPVVGVNKFVEREEHVDIEMHPYDPTTANRQIAHTQRVRRERDNRMVQALLEKLVHVAKNDTQNIMPVTIELVREGATMGDIVEQLKTVWGTYREIPVF